MTPFEDLDLYRLDDLLSDDERRVRDETRAFIAEACMPFVEDWFWDAAAPPDLYRRFGDAGLLGAGYEGPGLRGLGPVAYGLINQEVERCDSGLRTMVSVQSALVMSPILRWGSEEQRRRWIQCLARGEAVGAFGLTEPGAGSNPGAMTTTARRDGDGWVLDGAKMWIGNASVADLTLVWARTGDGVRGFLVEKGTPGFHPSTIEGKWSLRIPVTSEIRLDACRVDDSARLPGIEGLKNALMCLNEARYGIAWGAVGSAMATFEAALAWARGRVQFGGRPVASHQLVQDKLAWMFAEITKAWLLVHRLGRLKAQGRAAHQAISLAKRDNVQVARTCARMCREIHGAVGITRDCPAMRHMMNLESVVTYEGTHEVHTLVLGEHLTGERAFAPPAE